MANSNDTQDIFDKLEEFVWEEACKEWEREIKVMNGK